MTGQNDFKNTPKKKNNPFVSNVLRNYIINMMYFASIVLASTCFVFITVFSGVWFLYHKYKNTFIETYILNKQSLITHYEVFNHTGTDSVPIQIHYIKAKGQQPSNVRNLLTEFKGKQYDINFQTVYLQPETDLTILRNSLFTKTNTSQGLGTGVANTIFNSVTSMLPWNRNTKSPTDSDGVQQQNKQKLHLFYIETVRLYSTLSNTSSKLRYTDKDKNKTYTVVFDISDIHQKDKYTDVTLEELSNVFTTCPYTDEYCWMNSGIFSYLPFGTQGAIIIIYLFYKALNVYTITIHKDDHTKYSIISSVPPIFRKTDEYNLINIESIYSLFLQNGFDKTSQILQEVLTNKKTPFHGIVFGKNSCVIIESYLLHNLKLSSEKNYNMVDIYDNFNEFGNYDDVTPARARLLK